MMTADHRTQYEQLQGFSFDEGNPALPFASRLARENGWGEMYSARVIDEYRRFIFLAMSAGHPVTPSEQVDQVWHLHLLYTQSYWERFCGSVLARPLHHEPTQGGGDEQSKFNAWYDATLDSYRRFFGEPPPDIWPDARIRFGEDLHWQHVNTKRCWIVPKVWVFRLGLVALAAAGSTILAIGF